jgi:predicted metalloprotease
MRINDERESDNIEDRRGSGGGGRRGLVGGGIGTLVIALVAMYFGVDPSVVLNPLGNVPPTQQTVPQSAADAQEKSLMAKVLASTEDVWGAMFQAQGKQYQRPKLVLFSGQVDSACGYAEAAMGPFYCPSDHKLYLDMRFFNDLASRYGAPGDFAEAYVVAHEVGHHVQTLLGIADRTQAKQQATDKTGGNALQVRMELQADCYAGVWAYHAGQTRHILEPGDIEEALAAASGVGDDRLQQQARGYVVPESFTHGSSAQRMHWFSAGYANGNPAQCDTFAAVHL